MELRVALVFLRNREIYNNFYSICQASISGLLVECGKKWKIVRKILPNSAGNSAEKSEIVRENAK